MTLANLITPDVIRSYARAAVGVARACDRLQDQGYSVSIVPSRGASPMLRTAQSYRAQILKPLVGQAKQINLWKREFSDPLTAAIHIPFTADAGELGVKNLQSGQIRDFWARVVASIARGEKDSPYYRFYRFHRDVVCRVGHHDNMEHLLNTERFVFIDTVLSGQAVTEIADAFDALGLRQIHYLLLLDDHGARMHPTYAGRLRQLEGQGRATLIPMDSLFTEDQGPAVSGIWSVVMPTIMDVAREEVPAFSDGVVGAGLYYHEVMKRDDCTNIHFTSAIGRLHTILFQGLHAILDLDQVEEDLELRGLYFGDTERIDRALNFSAVMNENLPMAIGEYVEHLDAESLFEAEATRAVAASKVLAGGSSKATLEVSPSHCLRLELSKDDAAALVRRFRTQP